MSNLKSSNGPNGLFLFWHLELKINHDWTYELCIVIFSKSFSFRFCFLVFLFMGNTCWFPEIKQICHKAQLNIISQLKFRKKKEKDKRKKKILPLKKSIRSFHWCEAVKVVIGKKAVPVSQPWLISQFASSKSKTYFDWQREREMIGWYETRHRTGDQCNCTVFWFNAVVLFSAIFTV